MRSTDGLLQPTRHSNDKAQLINKCKKKIYVTNQQVNVISQTRFFFYQNVIENITLSILFLFCFSAKWFLKIDLIVETCKFDC